MSLIFTLYYRIIPDNNYVITESKFSDTDSVNIDGSMKTKAGLGGYRE